MSRAIARAAFAEMSSPGDVAMRIGKDRYDAIKRSDPHPLFVLLRIGHEGVSNGTLSVNGQTKATPKRWSRTAIAQLADLLNLEPGVFTGSHSDRDRPGRPRHGEVLSGYLSDDDNGRRIARAVCYITDSRTRESIQSGKLNVCSVEGDVVIIFDDDGVAVIDTVQSVSGVLLSDGTQETPGFAQAGVEAVVAELKPDDPFIKANPLDNSLCLCDYFQYGDDDSGDDDSGGFDADDPFIKANPLATE